MCERDRMLVAEGSDSFLWIKDKDLFLSCNLLLILIFFGHCRVTFPYKEIFSFFGPCHVTVPYMEPLFFFSRFVQKVILSCFSESFVQKTTQQSKSSCTVTSESQVLYNFFSKISLFISEKNKKNFLWVQNTLLRATKKRCASYPIAEIT